MEGMERILKIWKVACTRQDLILGGGIWECHQGRGGPTDLPTEDKGSIGFTTLATSEKSPPQNVGLSESYHLGVLLVLVSQNVVSSKYDRKSDGGGDFADQA